MPGSFLVNNDPMLSPTELNGHLVPGIWRYYLPEEVFAWTTPKETRATCLDCPKVVTEDFRPDYRCCTYHPRVPNYALGLALLDQEASPHVSKMLAGGHSIPEGSSHTPREWVDYLADNSEEKFGKSERVLCHFLNRENGYCRIYAYRNAVCSTFFCQHDNGERGSDFWEKLQILVGQIEAALSQWALEQVGFNFEKYLKRYNKLARSLKKIEQPGGGWSEKSRRHLFGEWYGREEELYKACAKLISEAREDLWAIASSVEILEPKAFEMAQIKAVPKEYQDEIDPEDFEDGESAEIDELWDDLKKSYKKLWKLPKKAVALNPRARFEPNDKKGKVAKHFKRFPYRLDFLTRKNGKAVDWFNHLTASEHEALQYFKRPRPINAKTLDAVKASGIKRPEEFISGWYGKKVLRQ